MEYRIIPMETYPRRAHFAYFSTMAQPYAGVTVSVEITHFLESVQEKGSPFFLSFLYCVSRAANQVPELRQRIWKGEIKTAQPPTRWPCRMRPTATACCAVKNHFKNICRRRYRPRRQRSAGRAWRMEQRRSPCLFCLSPPCLGSPMMALCSPRLLPPTPIPGLLGGVTAGRDHWPFSRFPFSATTHW